MPDVKGAVSSMKWELYEAQLQIDINLSTLAECADAFYDILHMIVKRRIWLQCFLDVALQKHANVDRIYTALRTHITDHPSFSTLVCEYSHFYLS